MTDNIDQRVRALLADVLGVEPQRVAGDGTLLLDDLGMDSLDAIELVMAAESEFSIELDDDRALEVTTVGEAIELVRSAL